MIMSVNFTLQIVINKQEEQEAATAMVYNMPLQIVPGNGRQSATTSRTLRWYTNSHWKLCVEWPTLCHCKLCTATVSKLPLQAVHCNGLHSEPPSRAGMQDYGVLYRLAESV